MNKGFFVAFEGPDGCGKSTISNLVYEKLIEEGYPVIKSREPGGTPISEKIRNIILDNDNVAMHPRTEALLYAAGRAQHVEEKIKPALEEGKIVLVERYILSSLIYQGIGRDLGVKEVFKVNQFATQNLEPDLTIILNPNKVTVSRKAKEGLDRLENAGVEFHTKVLNAYIEYGKTHEVLFVDASMSIEEVFEEVYREIKLRGGLK